MLAMVHEHPRHVVLFAAVAGMLLGPLSPAATLAAAALAAIVAGRRPLAIVAAVAVLAGALVAQGRVEALESSPLPTLSGRTLEARATLLEPVRPRAGGGAAARVRLLDPVRAGAATYRLGGDVAVARWRGAPRGLAVGRELWLRGVLAPLGVSDAYQRRRGAHARLMLRTWAATGRERGGAIGALDAVRERAARGLGAGLGSPEAALLRGMVLGQDEAIGEATQTAFQRSGLAHLLAVSGQNVLLLCTLALALGALVDLPLRARLLVAAALVAVYVPLAGGGPSIQRAGVMGIAGLVAALAGRPASRWYALGLAAAVTLAINPLAAGDPGWQLSFAAVAGLLAFAPGLRAALLRRTVPTAIAEAGAMTVAATLATAPLLALHFEQVSLASLPANLLAAPAVAPIMWLGMLAMAVAQIAPPLAAPLNLLCAPLLGYVEWVAHTAAELPLAAFTVRIGGAAGLAVAYAALGVAAFMVSRASGALRRRRRRPAVTLAAVTLAAGALWFGTDRPRHAVRPAAGELVVSFLDVGQGDATLLQTAEASVLVDTGPPGGPILRRLRESGVGRLDLLVLTHAEADHEGMALPIVQAHRPRLVLDGGAGWDTAVQRALPAAVAAVGGRPVAAHAGQVLRLGPLRLGVLWPPPPPPGWRPDGAPNDRAVVALVQNGAFDLLLPADAESNVTARLALPRVEAIKVAHHGSADAGLARLVQRLQPQVAAIEVGSHNTYGHPTPSALAALRAVPRLVRTDRDGTVRLHVAGGRMRLERLGAGKG
jgi:competence protein ComEC